jgi:Uma2 family endonuclease
MATKPVFETWTYDDFARLPRGDGNRYEVVAGELVVSSPDMPHQELIGRLHVLLRPFVDANGLGRVVLSPADVLFGAGDYFVPDLVFVRSDRLGIIRRRGIEGAPDLVIEVLSGSTAFRDRGIKRERYAYHGVAEYWVLNPGLSRIERYQLLDDASTPTVVNSGFLEWQPVPGGPALEIDVEALFRGLE